MDCSLLGFSVHGIFQARVLEWVAISFSRGSSWPRDWTQVSCIAGRHFTLWAKCSRHKRFDPWVRKIPWRAWQCTPVFLPEKSHGQTSLAGYSPWGCKELHTSHYFMKGTWAPVDFGIQGSPGTNTRLVYWGMIIFLSTKYVHILLGCHRAIYIHN